MRSKGMRSRADAGDPAREAAEYEDPARVMRWLRIAADVVERPKRGGGKKGGERADETGRKSAT
jgi:hypothetical protein